MTTATPSSLLAVVRPDAAAITSGWALPIAYEVPAQLSISTSFGMSPKATTSAGEIPRSAQHSARVLALETSFPLISSREVGLERVIAACSPSGGAGQRKELVRGQLGVVCEELEHRCGAFVRVLAQQFLGGGEVGARVLEERRVRRLVVDAGGQFDREGSTGRSSPQSVHDGEGVSSREGSYLYELVPGVEVHDRRAVRADREAVAVDVVTDHAHPAGRAAGDEEDLDAGLLGGRESGDRAGRDRLVIAQQGAVEVGGDEPGHGVWPVRALGSRGHGSIFAHCPGTAGPCAARPVPTARCFT